MEYWNTGIMERWNNGIEGIRGKEEQIFSGSLCFSLPRKEE